jgi:hypothetical protein
MTAAALEPFGFFSSDSLRAGWYLTWRLFLRLLPALIVVGLVAAGLTAVAGGLGAVVAGVLAVAALVWSVTLLPRITSQWAEQRYGRPLERWVSVWWGITWRTFVVAMVAAVILAVPNVVAVSLQTAYRDSALGMLGGLVVVVLSIGNFLVSVYATGWAMSRVAVAQLGGVEPLAPTWSPVEAPGPAVATGAAAAPAAMLGAPAGAAVATVAVEGKRQCPKCGLHETERGSVIGWYCRICGWRESRR